MNEEIKKFEEECRRTVNHLKNELSKIRGARASTGLLEGIMVDYYGAQTPLIQLGVLNAPEARLLTVQVFDSNALDSIEKAIQQAGLGLNPSRDGNFIRIPIPALTEDRRKEIVKTLGKMGEENKISVRNHRRDANDTLKKLKEDKAISEDDQKRGQDEVQKITDKYIAEVDAVMSEKEKEIMSV